MNDLTQQLLELSAIAFEKQQELESLKKEIEKLKLLLQYMKQEKEQEQESNPEE